MESCNEVFPFDYYPILHDRGRWEVLSAGANAASDVLHFDVAV